MSDPNTPSHSTSVNSESGPLAPSRTAFLLALTDVQKVRILLGRSVPEADPVTPLERQFLRAHLTPAESQLLWACL